MWGAKCLMKKQQTNQTDHKSLVTNTVTKQFNCDQFRKEKTDPVEKYKQEN